MKVKVKAYAKINLMLDILSRLENGYHDLFMIMQSVGIYDIVTVERAEDSEISITCSVPDIPTDERNVAYKAAAEFFDYTGIENSGVKIDIEKHIPHAAGLAGGSADAAAVITALDRLFNARLTEKDIIAIGSRVGADVPFCALGGTMLAQYTGTVLSHLPDLSEKYIIIVKPGQDISTGKAYAAFDTAERVRHLDTKGMLLACVSNDWAAISERVGNVFEQFIEVADRAVIKGIMRKHGCLCCCMSGSGPSIFGVFEEKDEAEKCLEELKKEYDSSYLCLPMKNGCEII
ncbi:MAG: 4-(cytidine 5'-diphospho)-2-C-methyl-D-erythritol kinase [Ruminococcaceae bacterium]|nr:4-(cytidine 5'-diphospho)-2-C-methyl-D-erythritol kinase [Oscillospiraceae bacterium]